MTPAQLEHLKLIDVHLECLLAIAEKRTPGEWMKSCFNVFTDSEESRLGVDGHHIADCDPANDKSASNAQSDAAFIAASAGNAEAGWRATRAVIKRFHDSAICREWHGYMQTAVEPILAAFPLELIQKP